LASRGKKSEYAGTNNTSSKVSASSRIRMAAPYRCRIRRGIVRCVVGAVNQLVQRFTTLPREAPL
jgi:hypothetical protein